MDKFGVKIKAIVKNEDRYLIVKRWYDDRISEPYQWEFPGGDLLFGEAPEAASERIVREQTGLDVRAQRNLYTWSYVVGDVCYIGICFLCEAYNEEVFLSEELLDSAWVSFDRLKDYDIDERIMTDVVRSGVQEEERFI